MMLIAKPYRLQDPKERVMGKGDRIMASFDRLRRDRTWQQIPNCPGRYRLVDRESNLTPVELIGEPLDIREYELPACPDTVLVAELHGGGLISYRRSNETYVHTLNTSDGFARKLRQLGIG